MANLGRSVGVDVWSYCGLEGQSIVSMIRFARSGMTSFQEYKSESQKFENRIEALLRLTPVDAASRAELPKPVIHPDQARVDDAINGLPPQRTVFLLAI